MINQTLSHACDSDVAACAANVHNSPPWPFPGISHTYAKRLNCGEFSMNTRPTALFLRQEIPFCIRLFHTPRQPWKPPRRTIALVAVKGLPEGFIASHYRFSKGIHEGDIEVLLAADGRLRHRPRNQHRSAPTGRRRFCLYRAVVCHRSDADHLQRPEQRAYQRAR
ncbi:hypothetical protein ALQ53_03362 [Pseudomonas cannabina]|uniref:Uncharacterized protein n=1 Tax=Pseudomonas cannabina TaxID=86840 RepID=A0A3M3RMT8_PSECA|nr:hypothetical protein ALQ53_03362 [Pseudomonas cannabina]RMN97511.1 hypothetical protein ALQ51_04082 [Pseudomonas cannabina]